MIKAERERILKITSKHIQTLDRTTGNLDGLVETQNKLFMKWEALSFGLDLKTEAGDELHYVETYYLLQKSKGGKYISTISDIGQV